MEGCHTGIDERNLDETVGTSWVFLGAYFARSSIDRHEDWHRRHSTHIEPDGSWAAKLDPRDMHFKRLDILPVIVKTISHEKFSAHMRNSH